MPRFSRLIRFQAADSDEIYFADLGVDMLEAPKPGSKINAHKSFDELGSGKAVEVTLGKVNILNSRSTISFANLNIAACAPSLSRSADLLRWHEL